MDEHAWVADWFVASSPLIVASRSIEGRGDGAFVIRQESPTQLQLLLKTGGHVRVFPMEVNEAGLHLQGSRTFFTCLSDLVVYYRHELCEG